MHIMLLAPGNATHTRRLLDMLLGAGHTVTYVDKMDPKPDDAGNYTYVKYPNQSGLKWINPWTFRRFLINMASAASLRRIWNIKKPDIVHLVGIDVRAYQCFLARLHPLILTSWGSDINDLYELGEPDSIQYKEIVKALKKADHITADTHELLNRCESLARCPRKKSLFYFGIDMDLFKPRSAIETQTMRLELRIPSDAKIILSARRLIPKMRHDIVLRAFAEILGSNLNVVLVFRRFGLDVEKYEDELRKLANELGVLDRIFWLDEMDYGQIPLLYNLANVIVNVPEQDGLPVTLFEASACMTPVITSDLPAYQEFLSGGDYFCVSVGDVAELAKAIKLVLVDNKNLIRQLEKNYQLVDKTANQKKSISDLERIYSRFAS
jgi:glycosyltransferase involved in cell wall biosynthesis